MTPKPALDLEALRCRRAQKPIGWSTDTDGIVSITVAERDALITALRSSRLMMEALEEIAAIKPEPFDFPTDWREQIRACPECARYRGHPVQQGICDTHRRPLWDRDKHDDHQEKIEGIRARRIAQSALTTIKEKTT